MFHLLSTIIWDTLQTCLYLRKCIDIFVFQYATSKQPKDKQIVFSIVIDKEDTFQVSTKRSNSVPKTLFDLKMLKNNNVKIGI